jgi:glycosyltransferase involved in cell wall biosynthesis
MNMLVKRSVRPTLAVIVRTLADSRRGEMLNRAIESIQRLRKVVATPIIVVNGKSFDADVLDSLYARDDVRVIYIETASAGAAITYGRRAVEDEFFMYLDDDDELVSGGIDSLLTDYAGQANWDVLIANGNRHSAAGICPWIEHMERHASDPLAGLVTENWLSPGNSVFRTETINSESLRVDRDHHEWTYIAYHLLFEQRRIEFVDRIVAIYNDTSESMSKRTLHEPEELRLLEDLLEDERLSPDMRRAIEDKYRNLLHITAERYRLAGHTMSAWHYHLRSLRPPYTLRYIAFTRRLLGVR